MTVSALLFPNSTASPPRKTNPGTILQVIHQLSNLVCFGDCGAIKDAHSFRSIINVAHNCRRHYWKDLPHIPWEIWTFRLALPDAYEVDDSYILAFVSILDAIKQADKLPLLCHCRMGGHRGPTAAIFASWHYGGRKTKNLVNYIAEVQTVKSGYVEKKRLGYRRSMLKYCFENSV